MGLQSINNNNNNTTSLQREQQQPLPIQQNSADIQQNNNIQQNKPEINDKIDLPTHTEVTDEEFKELEQNGKVCIICLEPYAENLTPYKIPCGHCFCKNCIMKSTEINPYCPVCRSVVDYDKEFNGGVRRAQPSQGQVQQQIPMTQNWNIHTIRNLFSVDPYFNRGNDNFFNTRFRVDTRFIQSRNVFNHDSFFQNRMVSMGMQNAPQRANRNNNNSVYINLGNLLSNTEFCRPHAFSLRF
jgi:hypothetical protein